MKNAAGNKCTAALNQFWWRFSALEGLGYMTGTDAAGTSLDGHNAPVFYGLDFLKIRVPDGTGFVVSMAHVIAEAGTFATDIAFS
jgi:hypothetical protein